MDPVEFNFWSHAKNLQGDIVAVYNQSGVKCISYVYDAWGNTTRTIHNGSGTNAYAQYNPFTYRGYYYDSEMGLCYLNSRYYDPQTGRFLNGPRKIGLTISQDVDFKNRTAGAYCHYYIRPMTIIPVAAAVYLTGGAASPIFAAPALG